MIKGIGMDTIEIARIEAAIKKDGFLERYFTIKEITFFEQHKMNPQKIAGNFCVKEAVVKMFGTGFRHVRLVDIEVLRDNLGKPFVNLSNTAIAISNAMHLDTIHVTITNTKEYASAVAIGERL
jgi:holo-[acyl-carrier protein] synthase